MEKHHHILKFLLGGGSVKQKTIMLKALDVEQGRMLSEIVVNILYGVLPITLHYKRKLQHFKTLWAKLATGSDISRVALISKNVKPVLLMLKSVSNLV